jgi:hypothetical protein
LQVSCRAYGVARKAWARTWAGALLALAVSGPAAAAEEGPPAWPTIKQLYLPDSPAFAVAADGELSWLGLAVVSSRGPSCGGPELGRVRWNPATGAVHHDLLQPAVSMSDVRAGVALPTGLMAWTISGCEGGNLERIVFLPTGAQTPLTVEMPKGQPFAIRGPAQMLPLGPDAAAFVARDEQRRVRVVTIRRSGNQLAVSDMPVLEGAMRGDFAVAIAARDRVMILGGSDDEYRGCMNCHAGTHVLDLKRREWRAGPPMLEGRSEAAATALPDGSVLVSGGWTKKADWSNGPSFTAERWNPATDRFEPLPPMPNANARHRFLWWHAPWGDTLLSVMGVAGAAHAFDPATQSWRAAAAWDTGSEEGGCGFFPFVLRGQAYAWQRLRSQGAYSTRSCDDIYSLSLMTPPARTPAAPPPESALISHRYDTTFLPAEGAAPALVIGGHLNGGMNRQLFSAAVEAVGRGGGVAALPALLTARAEARAVRVAGGVLVWGGRGPDQAARFDRDPKAPPAEWLSLAEAAAPVAWQTVHGAAPDVNAAVTALPDGSLLAVSPAGELRQLKLEQRQGGPTLVAAPWPQFSSLRRTGPDAADKLGIQVTPKGRIVVAGGAVRTERIALLTPKALQAEGPDEYVPIGPFAGSQQNDVFDPVTRRWTVSASSEAWGGPVLMLADGRVVKRGQVAVEAGSNEPLRYLREIFDPERGTWSRFEPAGSSLAENYRYRLFTLEGELFASGELAGQADERELRGVEWLNPKSQRWELIWQSRPRDELAGRLIVRGIEGAGAQRKTLVIPVEGF